MAKFCTPTWLARSVQEEPRRFLKDKAKGPPHSFTLTLHLEKRSWSDFYEKKRPTLNHSFSPITLHSLCKKLFSPLPTKKQLSFTLFLHRTQKTLSDSFSYLFWTPLLIFISVFSQRFLHESSLFWSLVYVDTLFVPFGDHLVGQKFLRPQKGHSGR